MWRSISLHYYYYYYSLSIVVGCSISLQKFNISTTKAIVHQVTTKLATAKNVLFLDHYHLLTTSTGAQAIINVSSHHRWLVGGYDLVIGHF